MDGLTKDGAKQLFQLIMIYSCLQFLPGNFYIMVEKMRYVEKSLYVGHMR